MFLRRQARNEGRLPAELLQTIQISLAKGTCGPAIFRSHSTMMKGRLLGNFHCQTDSGVGLELGILQQNKKPILSETPLVWSNTGDYTTPAQPTLRVPLGLSIGVSQTPTPPTKLSRRNLHRPKPNQTFLASMAGFLLGGCRRLPQNEGSYTAQAQEIMCGPARPHKASESLVRGMSHDPVVLLPLKCSRGLPLLEARSLTQV